LNTTLKTTTAILTGLIVVGITVAIFFLGTDSSREALDWLSLSFVLLSEIVLFAILTYFAMQTSESNERIIRTGILTTISIYWAVSLVLALVRHLFDAHQKAFVVINIILIGTVSIISVILNIVAANVQSTDRKIRNQMLFWLEIEKRLFSIVSNEDNNEFRQGLSSLYEKVKFSDKVGSSSYDKAILEELDNLELALCNKGKDRHTKIEKVVSQLLFFVKQRNMELSQSKRGGL
jgi:hypothetical protein